MALLALDIGTTHLKTALFAQDGRLLRYLACPTPREFAAQEVEVYAPQALWEATCDLLAGVLEGFKEPVSALGISSMAESGLLVERQSGRALTPILPWFDSRARPQAARLAALEDEARFLRAGIRPSAKCGLAKLLWLQECSPGLLSGAVWLSAADFVVYRLTGTAVTDPSLAGRTCAFDLNRSDWDTDYLAAVDLDPTLFPGVYPSGVPAGPAGAFGPAGASGPASASGLQVLAGVPVAVVGHDHVVAAFGVGATLGGWPANRALDSLGTAEALLGLLPIRPPGGSKLPAEAYTSGLSFGASISPGRVYWNGGLATAGGSLDWLRGILGDPPLDYAGVENLLTQAREGPTGIVYLPYLAGSNAPHTNSNARAALLGLDARHGRAELLKAVLEGVSFEIEYVRRTAQQRLALSLDEIFVVGGLTHLRAWMQIKADVLGRPLHLVNAGEATLLGAALTAGLGAGVFTSEMAMQAHLVRPRIETLEPDPDRHAAYQALYTDVFLPAIADA